MVVYETADGMRLHAEPDWRAWKGLDAYERGGDVVMVCREKTPAEARRDEVSLELAAKYEADMELLAGGA